MTTNKEYIKWLLDNKFYPNICEIGIDIPSYEFVKYEMGINYPLKLEIEPIEIQNVSVLLKFKFPEIGIEFEDRIYQTTKKSPEDFYNKVGEKAYIKMFSLKKEDDSYNKLLSLYNEFALKKVKEISETLKKIV